MEKSAEWTLLNWQVSWITANHVMPSSNKCGYIYMGAHRHGQDIPDIKYKYVFPTDTFFYLFAPKTIITA
jgi:hypothetical protein